MEGVVSPSEVPSNGIGNGVFPTIDPVLVVEHLVQVLEVTLGATRKELENVGSLLSASRYPDTIQRCTRFATESQPALYVQKDIASHDTIESSVDLQGTLT